MAKSNTLFRRPAKASTGRIVPLNTPHLTEEKTNCWCNPEKSSNKVFSCQSPDVGSACMSRHMTVDGKSNYNCSLTFLGAAHAIPLPVPTIIVPFLRQKCIHKLSKSLELRGVISSRSTEFLHLSRTDGNPRSLSIREVLSRQK